MRLLLAALLALGVPPGSAHASTGATGLRIVVIAGEDAVNIIRQGTAVAPVVEVRDRNDLPVAGVAVRFAVEGGKAAAFAGGAPTLTVTTNAAGQAAAAGLHPLTTGALQIHVQAVLQGQTVAATIAQTNVLTAAEAASATGAGAAGGAASGSSGAAGAAAAGVAAGAAAGGGGISATTIGLIGAGVAGGAVAATQLGKSGGSQDDGVFVGAFAGTIQMDFSGCIRVERHSGTLRMELDTSGGGLSGSNARIDDGIEAVVSTTCSGGGSPGCPGRGACPRRRSRALWRTLPSRRSFRDRPKNLPSPAPCSSGSRAPPRPARSLGRSRRRFSCSFPVSPR